MLPVAIDYTPAHEQGAGIGRYVRELVSALAKIDDETSYRLFVSGLSARDELPSFPSNFSWRSTRITPKWLARIWHRLNLPLMVNTFVGDVSLFHATDFVLPPASRRTKTLLTVHDLSFVRVPDAASPRLKAYLDQVVPYSIKKADHILADSEATRQDLISLYAVSPDKITTLLSAANSHFKRVMPDHQIRQKYNLSATPYIFSVGTVQPRKNYSRTVQALAHLRQIGYDICLVIAGGRGWLEDELYQTIQQTGMHEHVHLIGFVDDVDLPCLYSMAECTAFPSLYEGFGFPVLESMACGTPVVTSNVSSLPEVAGDAALMIDPYDVEALIQALKNILDDTALKDDLRERGYAQARKFSWEHSARQLKTVYNQLLKD